MPDESTLLLIYFLAFFLSAFVIRAFLVYRSTGINPLVLSHTEDAGGYISAAFKVLIVACTFVILVLAYIPASIAWLGAIALLQALPLKWVGWTCLLLSLLWVLVAQAQMGTSWRIGIDRKNRTELINKGLFCISRNPIFLATRSTLLGFFLVAPNAVTLAILATGEVLVQVQVRLEEKHLAELHDAAYDLYRSKVPRWLLQSG